MRGKLAIQAPGKKVIIGPIFDLRYLMDYPSLGDEGLIRLLSGRDPNALSELYDRYGKLVFSIALKVVGNRGTAEDITQDVFIRIWEKAETFNPGRSKLSTWIASIARNRSIDVLRKGGAAKPVEVEFWAEVDEDAFSHPETTESQVDVLIQQKRVRAAVQQLPKEQQQVLGLAYFKGMTHREIAEELGLPLGTVKTRIRSAMTRLRDVLGEAA